MYRAGLIFLVLVWGCNTGISKKDLQLLNGYWEISSAESSEGSTRKFEAGEIIDFMQLDGTSGYRKKLRPMPDGTFRTSDDATLFEIMERKGNFIINYSGNDTEWEEKLVSLDTSSFSVVNELGYIYRYVRFNQNQQ